MKKILLEIDDEVHANFKSKCAKLQTSMKDEITKFMKEFCEEKAGE